MKLLNFIFTVMKELTGDEHKVLSIIANTLNLNNSNRLPILRQKIAEIAGWWDEDKPKYSLNKVSKITNTLEEKGFLKKDEIFNENGKSIIFYSIPMLEVSKKVEKKVESFNETCQKNVAHNSMYNNYKNKYDKIEINKKEIKQNKTIELETNIINDIDNRKKIEEELKQWWTATMKNN